jgi:hypothetical protein
LTDFLALNAADEQLADSALADTHSTILPTTANVARCSASATSQVDLTGMGFDVAGEQHSPSRTCQ